MPELAQGSVWLAEFAEGYERPCVVVTRGILNRGRLVLVVPCSASDVPEKARFPNNVMLLSGAGGLPADSVAMTHLVQPIEAAALRHQYGTLSDEDLTRVLAGLAWVVDLFDHV